MCEGSVSIAVDRDGVEGACGGCEVLPVGLLTRLRSDRSWSCERVTGLTVDTDCGSASAKLVLGAGNGTRRGRHY